MTTQIAVRNAKAVKKTDTGPGAVAQEALQVTWLLKGNLKNAQLGYTQGYGAASQVIREPRQPACPP